jgi:hypothetical protein
LGRLQVGVGFIEVLQGNHSPDIGIDAIHGHRSSLSSRSEPATFCLPAAFCLRSKLQEKGQIDQIPKNA